MNKTIKSFKDDNKGATAVMTAVLGMVLVMVCGLSIDYAAVSLQKRTAQGNVDLAAISAAANLDGTEAAAAATLSLNHAPGIGKLDVKLGRYTPDRAIPDNERFVEGETPFNAAYVETSELASMYFAGLFDSAKPSMTVSAIAAISQEANFAIGSRLLRVEGGVLNDMLNAMTGSSLSLTAADYRALARTKVDMFDFMDELASSADVTAGTYDDVLSSDVSFGQFADAMARTVSNGDGTTSARAATSTFASGSRTAEAKVPLNKMFDLGNAGSVNIGEAGPGLGATLDALQMLSAAAAAANGKHQLELNLGASVPGLAGLTLAMAVGEPPMESAWVTIGAEGAKVATRQVRLEMVATVGGGSVLPGMSIKLPVLLEVAHAEAELTRIECSLSNPDRNSVTVEARPGIVSAAIADPDSWQLDKFGLPLTRSSADLVKAPLLRVSAASFIEIADTSPTPLRFSARQIGSGVPKTVTTKNYTESLVTSLLSKADIKISTVGLTLPLGGLGVGSSQVVNLLKPVAATLDKVLSSVLTGAGVHLGEADVWVNGVRCEPPVLVQ